MRSIDFWRSPGTGDWTILIRILLAGVFVFEGIQKLIHPDKLGAGRFEKIGIPFPELMGPFVGWVELICGLMFIVGFFARAAAVPIIIVMIVAIVSTKYPVLLGEDWGMFKVRKLETYGFWSMMHEIRNDWAMFFGACFILLSGAGRWSVDAALARRTDTRAP